MWVLGIKILSPSFFFFPCMTGSHYVTLTGLKLSVYIKLILNLQRSCHCLLSAVIKGTHHHVHSPSFDLHSTLLLPVITPGCTLEPLTLTLVAIVQCLPQHPAHRSREQNNCYRVLFSTFKGGDSLNFLGMREK